MMYTIIIVTQQTKENIMSNEINYTAGNGMKVCISAERYLDSVSLYAAIDGKRELSSKVTMLDKPVTIGESVVVAQIGHIGLTQARLDLVNAMIAECQAEIDADPKVNERKLMQQRGALADAVGYIIGAAHEEHMRNVERGWSRVSARDYDAEESVARALLAEFDAAHPEIIAAIEAERSRRVESAMWN